MYIVEVKLRYHIDDKNILLLGIEPRPLGILGTHSTAELYSPSPK